MTHTNGRDAALQASRQDPRAPRIFARTLFKDMTENGLTDEQILSVASELIGMVTDHLKDAREETKGQA